MKILQIMPCFSGVNEPVRLKLFDRKNPSQNSSENIAGLALLEDENGEQSIEWIVWDMDRSIRITGGIIQNIKNKRGKQK